MLESPIDQLRREHDVVLMVVEAMEHEVAAIDRTGVVSRVRVAQMMDFALNFTDAGHHRKEELALFPALVERSPTAGGPVGLMLSERREGRETVRAIEEALPDVDIDDGDRETVAAGLGRYADLLRRHIANENAVLFPLAELILSDQEQELLAGEFRRIEELESGAGERERYQALARGLARTSPAGRFDPELAA
jgi:hemerythrin-like domain-containing protein